MNRSQEPTPAELALIAVALAKNNGTAPSESLLDAHSLWMSAWLYLAGEEARQADRKAEMRIQKIEPLLPFDDFLKTKMPTLSKSYRRKMFFDFLLTGYILKIFPNHSPKTESQNSHRTSSKSVKRTAFPPAPILVSRIGTEPESAPGRQKARRPHTQADRQQRRRRNVKGPLTARQRRGRAALSTTPWKCWR